MKKIMVAGLLVMGAMSSAAVFAQSVDSPITRADVKAQLVAAQKDGQLDVVRTESYPQLLPYQAAQRVNAMSASEATLAQANASRMRVQ